MPRQSLRILILWAAGVVALVLGDQALAQGNQSAQSGMDQAVFAALNLTADGIAPTELVVPPGAPVVLQLRNLDDQPHCLTVAVPSAVQSLGLGTGTSDELPVADCPDVDLPPENVSGGDAGITLPPTDVSRMQAGVQCGLTASTGDRRAGTWAYALRTPLLAGERATLCFFVSQPGVYQVVDPLQPTFASVDLVVGGVGAAGPPLAQASTATPTTTATVGAAGTATPDPFATATVNPFATPTVDPFATATVNPFVTPTADPFATPTVDPFATPTVDPLSGAAQNPLATATVVSPGGLPTTGAAEEVAGQIPFWLLLGIWTLAMAALFRRMVV